MKITAITALLLIHLYASPAYCQSTNRRKVIDMLLTERKPAKEQVNYPITSYATDVKKGVSPPISFCEPIPKFQLPHGAVICRFEEYVQLHSPFKLNIGVGGE